MTSLGEEKVKVGEMVDPGRFWVCLHHSVNPVQNLVETIEKSIGEIGNDDGTAATPRVNQLVGVQDPDSGQWFRGTVTELKEDHCKVFLVDHGRHIHVKKTSVCELGERFRELPGQAFQVYLYGVIPVNEECAGGKGKWSDEAFTFVQRILQNASMICMAWKDVARDSGVVYGDLVVYIRRKMMLSQLLVTNDFASFNETLFREIYGLPKKVLSDVDNHLQLDSRKHDCPPKTKKVPETEKSMNTRKNDRNHRLSCSESSEKDTCDEEKSSKKSEILLIAETEKTSECQERNTNIKKEKGDLIPKCVTGKEKRLRKFRHKSSEASVPSANKSTEKTAVSSPLSKSSEGTTYQRSNEEEGNSDTEFRREFSVTDVVAEVDKSDRSSSEDNSSLFLSKFCKYVQCRTSAPLTDPQPLKCEEKVEKIKDSDSKSPAPAPMADPQPLKCEEKVEKIKASDSKSPSSAADPQLRKCEEIVEKVKALDSKSPSSDPLANPQPQKCEDRVQKIKASDSESPSPAPLANPQSQKCEVVVEKSFLSQYSKYNKSRKTDQLSSKNTSQLSTGHELAKKELSKSVHGARVSKSEEQVMRKDSAGCSSSSSSTACNANMILEKSVSSECTTKKGPGSNDPVEEIQELSPTVKKSGELLAVDKTVQNPLDEKLTSAKEVGELLSNVSDDAENSDEDGLVLSKYSKYSTFKKCVEKKEAAAAAAEEEEARKKCISVEALPFWAVPGVYSDQTTGVNCNDQLSLVDSGDEKPIQPIEFEKMDFVSALKETLNNTIKNLTALQKYVWPALLGGKDVLMVAPPSRNRILAYAVPFLQFILFDFAMKNISKGNGAILLILCSGSRSCTAIEKVFTSLLKKTQSVFVRAVYEDESSMKMQISLINGLDILITTPLSLQRLRCAGRSVFNLSRLLYVVIDDADILIEHFPTELKNLLYTLHYSVKKRNENDSLQTVISAQTWTQSLDIFAKNYRSSVVCISSIIDTTVFLRIKSFLYFIDEMEKCSILVDLIENNLEERIVVVCNTLLEIEQLEEVMKESPWESLFFKAQAMSADEIGEAVSVWKSELKKGVIVCTDADLPVLQIENGSQLIHFSLPKGGESQFGSRFSVLLERMKKGKLGEGENLSPVHIFITPSDMEELLPVGDLLKHMNLQVPTQLEDRIKCFEEQLELCKNASLCFYWKAFGKCRAQSKCPYRHVVCNEDKPVFELSYDRVNIEIKSIHGANCFSASLLEYTDAEGNIQKVANEEMTILMRLWKYFKNDENRHLVSDPKSQTVCALKISEGVFQRVEILAVVRGDNQSTEVHVRLMDRGAFAIVKEEQLFELPQELQAIPPVTFEVYVCGIQPCNNDMDWSQGVCEKVKQLILKEYEPGVVIIGKVKAALGSALWFEQLHLYEILRKLKTGAFRLTLPKKILKLNWASENFEHLRQIREACISIGLEFPDEQYAGNESMLGPESKEEKSICEDEKEETEEEEEESENSSLEVQWAFLPEGCEPVIFTVSYSPDEFFIRRRSFDDCYQQLKKEIKKIAEKRKVPKKPFSVGDYCLARMWEETWDRAQVLSVQDEYVRVYFVDQGDEGTIPFSSTRRAKRYIFTKLPFQAVPCSLAAVKPKEGEGWSDEAKDMFYEIMFESHVNKRILFTKVMKKVQSAEFGSGYKYEVVLFEKHNEEHLILNQLLVERALAFQSEEEKSAMDELKNSGHLNVCDWSEVDIEEENQPFPVNNLDVSDIENQQIPVRNLDVPELPADLADIGSPRNLLRVQRNDPYNFKWDELDLEDLRDFFHLEVGKENPGDGMKALLPAESSIEESKKPVEGEEMSDGESSVTSLGESKENESENPIEAFTECEASSEASAEEDNVAIEVQPRLILVNKPPPIEWQQNSYFVWIKVDIPQVSDYCFDWGVDWLELWVKAKETTYGFKTKLFGAVHDKKVKHLNGLYLVIKFLKLHVGTQWPRLFQVESSFPWVKQNYVDQEAEKLDVQTLLAMQEIDNALKGTEDDEVSESYSSDDSDIEKLHGDGEDFDPHNPLN